MHGTCRKATGHCYCEPYYGARDKQQQQPVPYTECQTTNGRESCRTVEASAQIAAVGVDSGTFCRQRQCEDPTCSYHGTCVHETIDRVYCDCDMCWGGMNCDIELQVVMPLPSRTHRQRASAPHD